MKGELGGLVAVVALWLSGYGSYSQTPWVKPFESHSCRYSLFSFLLSRLVSSETSESIILTHLLIQYDLLIKNLI